MIVAGASDNLIGTNGQSVDNAGEGNLISGNDFDGVDIHGAGTTGNIVAGNKIGTNAAGTAALANADLGVNVSGGATSNVIGSNGNGVGDQYKGNLISGNVQAGVQFLGTGTDYNVLAGNLIGTDVSGTYAIPNSTSNQECGVFIGYGAAFNIIGTDGIDADPSGDRNVISGNRGYDGLVIQDGFDNIVAGNFIGTNASGLAALPNVGNGMEIKAGSQGNLIGTNGAGVDDAAERNVISGNDGDGIQIWHAGTSGNVVAGNYIGTNADGTAALGNGAAGIRIYDGASGNWIGVNSVFNPETPDEGNVISGNTSDGVEMSGAGTSGNFVAGNLIGTDATGTIAIANYAGVEIDSGASGNLIGASGASSVTDPLERNIISGNTFAGVWMTGTGTDNNVVGAITSVPTSRARSRSATETELRI